VDTIQHIIKRDFFPAVSALESVLSGNPLTPDSLRVGTPDSALRRNSTRPSSVVSHNGGSFEPETPDLIGAKKTSSKSEFVVPKSRPPKSEKKDMRLAEFLARHTSEDNESFEEILDKDSQALTEKRVWLAELQDQADKLKLLAQDPKRTGMIETWNYKTINHLLFYPDTHHSTQEISPAGDKEIVLSNTRFPGGFFDKPKEGDVTVAALQSAMKSNETGSNTPAINGYKFLRTPSPAPGTGGESPQMTWGDIIGTPLRLEDDDIEQDRKAKIARFKVPETPDREQLGRQLDEKVMIKNREKKKKKKLMTPSPALTPGRSPITLSPAALKLLKAKRASMLGSDSQLRASYRSPSLFPSGARSQKGRSTPSPFGLPSVTPVRSPAATPTPEPPQSPEFDLP